MTQRLVCLFAIFLSGEAAAAECDGVIELSKIKSTVTASSAELQSNATAFCSAFNSNKSAGNNSNFGGSYKFLSATFSSGKASQEEVASRYCSSSDSSSAASNAYSKYVESIAPGAYAAYNACVSAKSSDIKFDVDPSSVLPKQFVMTVSFTASGSQQAQILATPSDGVRCAWNSGPDMRSTLKSPQTETLTCSRSNSGERSFVTVTRVNGSERFTVPWKAYTSEGVPLDTMRELIASINRLESKMVPSGAVIAFHLQTCPEGWSKYSQAIGRFVRGIDPTGYERQLGSVQEDAFQGHTFGDGGDKLLRWSPDYKSNAQQNGHPQMQATGIFGPKGSNPNFINNKDAMIVTNGSDGAPRTASETRPKNVGLLFCRKS